MVYFNKRKSCKFPVKFMETMTHVSVLVKFEAGAVKENLKDVLYISISNREEDLRTRKES